VKREGQEDFWIALGAAFMHQDGAGFNVILQALPLPSGDGTCKIALRPPKDEKDRQQPQGTAPPQTNPALDAGSRPRSEGRLKSRRQYTARFLAIGRAFPLRRNSGEFLPLLW
jgi:hypothetical protein